MSAAEHLLLFGASGAIGQEIGRAASASGWRVTGVSRKTSPSDLNGVEILSADPFSTTELASVLSSRGPFSAVCWAQGANRNDSVYDVDAEEHLALYRANVLFILTTLKTLLTNGLLTKPARMCVISSIWQNLARQSKLSYCTSKAALQGLVLSAAADLAQDGHLINAVLPGALDTPMTRRNLSPDQIDRLSRATSFNRLPQLEDVSSLVLYLCSQSNTGITGQFISADLGFGHVRLV